MNYQERQRVVMSGGGSIQARSAYDGADLPDEVECEYCFGDGKVFEDEAGMAKLLGNSSLPTDVKLLIARQWFENEGEITCPFCDGEGKIRR